MESIAQFVREWGTGREIAARPVPKGERLYHFSPALMYLCGLTAPEASWSGAAE